MNNTPVEFAEEFPAGLAKKFVPVRLLGRGEGASVYLVQEVADGGQARQCAMRLTLPQVQLNEEAARLFLSDARDAGKLKHASIIQNFGAGKLSGRHFIAMELAPGTTVHDILKRTREQGQRIPESLVVGIGRACASALAFAHRQTTSDGASFVHGDLNPGNVFVTPDGVARIGEFGVARAAAQSVTPSTDPELVPPRWTYRAPEVVLRQCAADGRSDVFSLAMILVEMLAGQPVHPAARLSQMQEAWRSFPPDVGALAPSCSGPLATLLMSALDPALVHRPSAEELHQRLSALAAAHPVMSTACLTAARSPSWVKEVAFDQATAGPPLERETKASKKKGNKRNQEALVDPFVYQDPAAVAGKRVRRDGGAFAFFGAVVPVVLVVGVGLWLWKLPPAALSLSKVTGTHFEISGPPTADILEVQSDPARPGELRLVNFAKYGPREHHLNLGQLGLPSHTRAQDVTLVFEKESPNHVTLRTSSGQEVKLTPEQLGYPEGIDINYLQAESHNRRLFGKLENMLQPLRKGK